jgi:hypothetical protein
METRHVMSFQETPDFREFLDTQTLYLVRLLKVTDQNTRLGEALRWEFEIHDRANGAPIVDADDNTIVVSRLTSPRLGPRSRARGFVNKLLGRELARDELRTLVQNRRLADQLKGKTALAYVSFQDADGNETEFPKIDELFPVEGGKSTKRVPPPPRSYEAVFDDDDPKNVASSSESDLPF